MTSVRRDTTTGGVMEQMVLPALEHGGYEYFRQVDIGERLGGGRHIVDLIAYDIEHTGFLISLKWQQSSGTAEQKVPFEAMCLAEAVRTSDGRAGRMTAIWHDGGGWRRTCATPRW